MNFNPNLPIMTTPYKLLPLILFCTLNFISFSQSQMDICIANVEIKPINPKPGDKLIISYKVRNDSKKTISEQTYSVILKINGEVVSFDDETAAIPPGQSIVYSKAQGSYHKFISKRGSYTWEIKVKTKFKDETPKNNLQKGVILVN